MSDYINVFEFGMFLSIGLFFIALHIFFILRRYIRTRYAMVGVLASSVWPALMIVLSIQAIDLVPELTARTLSLASVLAWASVMTTLLMLLIPAMVLISRLFRVVDWPTRKKP